MHLNVFKELNKGTSLTRNGETVTEIFKRSLLRQNNGISISIAFFSAKAFCSLKAISSPETLESLKSFEIRSVDVILTMFPKMGESCLLYEEFTAAVQKCVTAHNTAVVLTAG